MKILSVRITTDLFNALTHAAAAADCRSLSHYVERTLARSISPTATPQTPTGATPKLTTPRRRSHSRLFPTPTLR